MGTFEIGEIVNLRSAGSYIELKEGDRGQIISISPRGWVTVDFERDGGAYTVYDHELVREDIYQLVLDLGLDPVKAANEDFNESWRL